MKTITIKQGEQKTITFGELVIRSAIKVTVRRNLRETRHISVQLTRDGIILSAKSSAIVSEAYDLTALIGRRWAKIADIHVQSSAVSVVDGIPRDYSLVDPLVPLSGEIITFLDGTMVRLGPGSGNAGGGTSTGGSSSSAATSSDNEPVAPPPLLFDHIVCDNSHGTHNNVMINSYLFAIASKYVYEHDVEQILPVDERSTNSNSIQAFNENFENQFTKWGMTNFTFIHKSGSTFDTQIAVAANSCAIMVVCRGSEPPRTDGGVKDWITTDLATNTYEIDGSTMHAGFFDAYKAVHEPDDEVSIAIQALRD